MCCVRVRARVYGYYLPLSTENNYEHQHPPTTSTLSTQTLFSEDAS